MARTPDNNRPLSTKKLHHEVFDRLPKWCQILKQLNEEIDREAKSQKSTSDDSA